MDSDLAVKQLREIRREFEKFGEEPRLAAEGWSENWQTLIAIMLSAQTRDTKTVEVCGRLFEKYPEVSDLAEAKVSEVEKDIGSINYYRTKARNIVEVARRIVEEGLREDVDFLVSLPGVGRKTANVYLVAVKNADVIGVDTHVGRISRKMGWASSLNPNEIEKELMELFPRKYWNSINWILVGFGQTVGRSRRREDVALERLGR